MAIPDLENGYTRIANEIVEALARVNLSAYESRVLWFILRKTYGWGKKTDWLTLSQFASCIGIDRRLVHRGIISLSSKKMIIIDRDDKGNIRYGIQKNFEKWKVSSKKMTVINRDDRVSSKEMNRVSSKEIPTKETITKETITKEKIKKIPPTLEDVIAYCQERDKGVDPQTWFDFYTAKNWMIGKNRMVDWRAAVRTWERGRNNGNGGNGDDLNAWAKRKQEQLSLEADVPDHIGEV